MISFLSFFFFFFLLMKSYIFFLDLYTLDASSGFMLSIGPLVLCLFFYSVFKSAALTQTWSIFFLFSGSLLFSLLSFLSCSVFLFLFYLELTVFPMLLSLLFFSKDEDKLSSVLFMAFINLSGSIPFMFFSSYVMSPSYFSSLLIDLNLSFFLLFCSSVVFLSKIPIFMLHFWLTKAHVSASGVFSMLLASIMLKMGTFGLFKFSSFFKVSFSFLFEISLCFSLLGTLFFFLLMVRFFDSKFMVACSSVVHMALIWPFVGFNSFMGVYSSLFMMTGHGLVSYVFFYLVSLFYETAQSRSIVANKSLESLSKTLSMVLFFFVFLNLGLPPFISFMTELFFCSVLYKISALSLFLFSGFMVCSILFTMFFLTKSFFGKKSILSGSSYSSSSFFLSIFYVPCLFFLAFLL